MDALTKAIVVRQIQTEYLAHAAAERLAAGAILGPSPAPAARRLPSAARLLVSLLLVAVGIGGLAGAEAQVAGPAPVDQPAPGFAD